MVFNQYILLIAILLCQAVQSRRLLANIDSQAQPQQREYDLLRSHTEGFASNCQSLGCSTESGGLEACKSRCDSTADCNLFNFCPSGATCHTLNRCCLRTCVSTSYKEIPKWGGWDIYLPSIMFSYRLKGKFGLEQVRIEGKKLTLKRKWTEFETKGESLRIEFLNDKKFHDVHFESDKQHDIVLESRWRGWKCRTAKPDKRCDKVRRGSFFWNGAYDVDFGQRSWKWAKTTESCNHAEQGNKGRYGAKGSVEHCQKECDKNAKCKGFSYKSTDKSCFMFVTKVCGKGALLPGNTPCTTTWCNYDKNYGIYTTRAPTTKAPITKAPTTLRSTLTLPPREPQVCGTTGKQSTGTIINTLPQEFEESKKTACDCRNSCNAESRCYSWDYRVLGEHRECTLRSGQILEESGDEHLIAGLSEVFSFVPGKDGFSKCADAGSKCKCTGFARFGGEINKGQYAYTPAYEIDSDVQCVEENFEPKLITKFGKSPFCECKHSELAGKFEVPSTSELYGFFATDEQKDKLSEDELRKILHSTAPLTAFAGEYPLGLIHAVDFPVVEMGIKSFKSCDAMKNPNFQQSGSPFFCGAPLALDLSAMIDGFEHVGLGIVSNALRGAVGDDKTFGTDNFFGLLDMCIGSFSMKSPAHRLMDTKCRTDIFDERKVAGTFSTHVTGWRGIDFCLTVNPCDGGFYFQTVNDWIAKNFIGLPTDIYTAAIVAVAEGSEMGFGVSPSKNFKRELTYWTGDNLHEGRVTEIFNGRFALNFQMDIGEGIQGLIQHMIRKGAQKLAKDSFISGDSSFLFKFAVNTGASVGATQISTKFAENRGWPILNDAFGTSKAEVMLGLDFIDELIKPDFGKWFEESEGSMIEKIMWLVAQNSALITLEAGFELNFKQLTRNKLDFVLPLADAKVQLLADGVNRRIHLAAQVRSNLIRQLCNLVAKLWPNMGDLGKATDEKTTFKKSKGPNSFQCPDWLNVFNIDAKIDVLLKMVDDEDETFQIGFRFEFENEHVQRIVQGSKLESCLETEFSCNMFFNKREPFIMRCNIFGNGVGTNDKGAAYQITETAEVGEGDLLKNLINKFGECGTGVQEIMNDWLIRRPVNKIKAIYAGFNEDYDNFLEDLGDGAKFLQMIGARDDNGFVYALGTGLKRTSQFLTIVKGLHDEAIESIRATCDKAFDRVERDCKRQANVFERRCDECAAKARNCDEKMREAQRECSKNFDTCEHCRSACRAVGEAACQTGNWIHEIAAANTIYAADVVWCGTQEAANKVCFFCDRFSYSDCERHAASERDRRIRKHQKGHEDCKRENERDCMRGNDCKWVENLFEDSQGRCDQVCDIALGKVIRNLGCKHIGKNVCTIGNCGARWFTEGFCDTLEAFGEICEKDERVNRRRQLSA